MISDCYQYCTIYNIIQYHDDVDLRKLNDFNNVISDIGITQHDEEQHVARVVRCYAQPLQPKGQTPPAPLKKNQMKRCMRPCYCTAMTSLAGLRTLACTAAASAPSNKDLMKRNMRL